MNIANSEILLDSVYLRFCTYTVREEKHVIKVHTVCSFSVLFYLLHVSVILDPLQREKPLVNTNGSRGSFVVISKFVI